MLNLPRPTPIFPCIPQHHPLKVVKFPNLKMTSCLSLSCSLRKQIINARMGAVNTLGIFTPARVLVSTVSLSLRWRLCKLERTLAKGMASLKLRRLASHSPAKLSQPQKLYAMLSGSLRAVCFRLWDLGYGNRNCAPAAPLPSNLLCKVSALMRKSPPQGALGR